MDHLETEVFARFRLPFEDRSSEDRTTYFNDKQIPNIVNWSLDSLRQHLKNVHIFNDYGYDADYYKRLLFTVHMQPHLHMVPHFPDLRIASHLLKMYFAYLKQSAPLSLFDQGTVQTPTIESIVHHMQQMTASKRQFVLCLIRFMRSIRTAQNVLVQIPNEILDCIYHSNDADKMVPIDDIMK